MLGMRFFIRDTVEIKEMQFCRVKRWMSFSWQRRAGPEEKMAENPLLSNPECAPGRTANLKMG